AIAVSVDARSVQPGELVVLTITLSDAREAVHVRAFDHEVPVYARPSTSSGRAKTPSTGLGRAETPSTGLGRAETPSTGLGRAETPSTGSGRAETDSGRAETWVALVGIDLDRKPGQYHVAIDAGGGLTADEPLRVLPKTFPTRRLTVDENFVNPPASVAERIARDSALLASIYAHPAAQRLWTTAFVRPVPQAANSRFGTRSIFNGQPRAPHGGADFLSPAGTPIHAPNAGRVVIARDLYFTGGTVIIDHGQGLFSMLAHMSYIDANEGDLVRAGDVVGAVGATGRVTGPHLHWAVRVNDARVD